MKNLIECIEEKKKVATGKGIKFYHLHQSYILAGLWRQVGIYPETEYNYKEKGNKTQEN